MRAKHNAVAGVGLSGDFGLLHAVDERLAAYGFETNTGVKFVVVVDMRGRRIDGSIAGLADKASRGAAAVGLREGEMKTVGATSIDTVRNAIFMKANRKARFLRQCRRHMFGYFRIRSMTLMNTRPRPVRAARRSRARSLPTTCVESERRGHQASRTYNF